MTDSILRITDGTTTISLIGGRDNWYLRSWIPAIAQSKGGGTWQQSSLSDGRRLVDRHYSNVIETLELKASRKIADSLIEVTQDLIRLLEDAVEYWIAGWQDNPVWIEKRASCETNTSYAVIHNWNIPQLNNPFAQPFLSEPRVFDDITLLLERGHWLDQAPGSDTALAISVLESYDDRSLGNVDSSGDREPTTDDEVYVANQGKVANITDIYVDDGGVFGPNLMDAALPFDLLPATPAVNDAVYFGIDTALTNDSFFNSLVFDLSVVQSDCTIVWEWFNFIPGNWSTVPRMQDNTDADGAMTGEPLDTLGVNSVHWVPDFDSTSSGWTTTAVNGVTAYWVRARVTAIGAAPSPPRQQNRDIYSVISSYIEIQSDQFTGDLPLLSRYIFTMQADRDGPAGSAPNLYIQRVIMGTRTLSRGENFVSFLNIADTNPQNPSGVTIADVGPGSIGFDSSGTPSRQRLQWATAAPVAMGDLVTITFDETIATDYYGEFHAFLRIFGVANAGRFNIRLQVRSGSGGILSTRSVQPNVASVFGFGDFQLMDMGVIEIPATEIVAQTEIFDEVVIAIQGEHPGSTSDTINIVDLILIPVDEWAGDFQDKADTADSTLERTRLLEVDSTVRPKARIRALLKDVPTDEVLGIYQSIAGEPILLQPGETQRVWFLTAFLSSGNWVSSYCTGITAQLSAVARYLGMRGSR